MLRLTLTDDSPTCREGEFSETRMRNSAYPRSTTPKRTSAKSHSHGPTQKFAR
jgi:hypothetical protein